MVWLVCCGGSVWFVSGSLGSIRCLCGGFVGRLVCLWWWLGWVLWWWVWVWAWLIFFFLCCGGGGGVVAAAAVVVCVVVMVVYCRGYIILL